MTFGRFLDLAAPLNDAHPLARGLVLRWQALPNRIGARSYPDLKNLFPGTIANAPRWCGPSSRIGGYGAMDFDNSSNHSVTATATSIGTGDFSMMSWVFPREISNFHPCVSLFNSGSNVLGGLYHANSGGNWAYYNGTMRTSGRTLTANAWTHVAIARRSGVIEFYQNGVSTGTTFSTDSSDFTVSVFTMGTEPRFSNDSFAIIDDARLYNRAISADEFLWAYRDSALGCPETLNWRRRLFPVASGGNQTLTVSAATATCTVVAPTLTPGAISLSVSPATVTGTVVAPTLTPGAVSLTVSPASVAASVVAPSVTAGAVSLTVSPATATASVVAPTLTPGAVSLSVSPALATCTVVAPTIVSDGAPQSISVTAAVATCTAIPPILVPGAVVLVMPVVTAHCTVVAPSIDDGTEVTFIPVTMSHLEGTRIGSRHLEGRSIGSRHLEGVRIGSRHLEGNKI